MNRKEKKLRETLNARQKAMFWGMIGGLVLVIALVVFLIVRTLNPAANQGTMYITSSEKTIEPVSNVLQTTTKGVETSFRALKLEDIADTLPTVEYDGEDITVGFSDDDTLENFSFSMYDEDLNEIYTGEEKFVFPESAGTYIVKTEFSWGYTEKNSILTENYYKVYFSEESLK